MSPGWTLRNLVEPMGFEPTTSSMPSRRAPNCATAPPESYCNNASIGRVGTSTTGRRSIVAKDSYWGTQKLQGTQKAAIERHGSELQDPMFPGRPGIQSGLGRSSSPLPEPVPSVGTLEAATSTMGAGTSFADKGSGGVVLASFSSASMAFNNSSPACAFAT